MNSERRHKKGLQRVPRGQNVTRVANIGYGSAREDYKPEQPPEVDYSKPEDIPEHGYSEEVQRSWNPNTQSWEINKEPDISGQTGMDIKGLETYELPNQVTLSPSEAIPDSADEEDSNKSRSAKFFGFVRNKFDEAVDDWKQKRQIKQQAYEKFLGQKPQMLQQRYESEYNQRLKEIANPSLAQNRILNTFGQVSKGMKDFGQFFGGRLRPDQVMGFKGTILGPLPTGISPMQEQIMMQQASGFRQDLRNPYLVQRPQISPQVYGPSAMPERYMQPGIQGAQVPKYASRPYNAQAGSEWGIIQKIDSYGKKRSYMRKLRVPGMQPQQQMQMRPQQQQQQQGRMVNVTQQMEQPKNPLGMGFVPERLQLMSQGSGVSPNQMQIGGSGIDMNNLINVMKKKAGQSGSNPSDFIYPRAKQTGFDPNRFI